MSRNFFLRLVGKFLVDEPFNFILLNFLISLSSNSKSSKASAFSIPSGKTSLDLFSNKDLFLEVKFYNLGSLIWVTESSKPLMVVFMKWFLEVLKGSNFVLVANSRPCPDYCMPVLCI